MKISNEFSRGSAILFFAGGLATLLSWRFLIANLISQSLANGSFARKKIIIIAEQDQHISSRPLTELRRYGYHPVKTCEVSQEEIASLGITRSLRSKLADVIQFARDEQIEDIYLLMNWRHHRAIYGILHALAVLPISVHLVPDENAAQFLNYPIANIGGTWTAVLRRAPLSHTERAAKRFFDLSLATAGLLTLLPLMLVTALLIKLDSRGPVFFLQKRNGFNGQAFNIFKFRTMHVLEDGPVILQATRNDPRVTRLGRWLRRSSIDELPQLFNVIRGDMSLVGPRPHAIIAQFRIRKTDRQLRLSASRQAGSDRVGAGQRLSRRDAPDRTDGASRRARSLVHQQLEPITRPENCTADRCRGSATNHGLLAGTYMSQ